MRILKVKAEVEPGSDIYDEMGGELPSDLEASEQEALADAVQDTDALMEALEIDVAEGGD